MTSQYKIYHIQPQYSYENFTVLNNIYPLNIKQLLVIAELFMLYLIGYSNFDYFDM